MAIVGIIAEYNPFHHGHAYQLQQIKAQLDVECVIVLMSGNVVQRGEFAIVDKWTRSQVALASGADVVVESPLFVSVQSADYFAKYSVALLAELGCDTLVFGTETATIEALNQYVDWLECHETTLQQDIQVALSQGVGYPKAYAMALAKHHSPATFDTSSPNHLLAIQYMRANRQLKKPMDVHTICRIQGVLSGSQVRHKWYANALTMDELPTAMYEKLRQTPTVQWQDYWQLLKYQLSVSTPSSLRHIVGVSEGIEHRLIRVATQSSSFDECVSQLVSKRWTKARVQRLLMMVLLQVRQDEWAMPNVLRLLALSSQGCQFVRQYQGERLLVANFKREDYKEYAMTLRADNVYQQAFSSISEQNQARIPIFC